MVPTIIWWTHYFQYGSYIGFNTTQPIWECTDEHIFCLTQLIDNPIPLQKAIMIDLIWERQVGGMQVEVAF